MWLDCASSAAQTPLRSFFIDWNISRVDWLEFFNIFIYPSLRVIEPICLYIKLEFRVHGRLSWDGWFVSGDLTTNNWYSEGKHHRIRYLRTIANQFYIELIRASELSSKYFSSALSRVMFSVKLSSKHSFLTSIMLNANHLHSKIPFAWCGAFAWIYVKKQWSVYFL